MGLFSPLKIVEIDSEQATCEAFCMWENDKLVLPISINGPVIDVTINSLESAYDYEGRTFDDKTAGERAYSNIIYPRVKNVKKDWVVKHNLYINAVFYYMYINDRVTITADKECFGRPPGSDIGDMFYLMRSGLIQNESEFELVVSHDKKIPFQRYFKTGALLPRWIGLFCDAMGGNLKEGETMQLTITLPVRAEHFWQYALAQERSYRDKTLQYSDKVFIINAKVSK